MPSLDLHARLAPGLALALMSFACGRSPLDLAADPDPPAKMNAFVVDAGVDVGFGRVDAGRDAAVVDAHDAGTVDARDAGQDGTADGPRDGGSDACIPVTGADALDQEAIGQVDLGGSINDGFRFSGQTYTAGFTGALTAVSIDLTAITGQFPAHVAIRRVAAGVPTSEILGETFLASGGGTLDDPATLAKPVPQVAGVQYAIVIDYPAAPSHGAGEDQGTWAGSAEDVYSGGEAFAIADDGSVLLQSTFDMHFRTFVAPCAR